jgi:type VI secretion system VasI/ImpG family protein
MEFLDYYRDNLHYIRVLAQEFAAEFPKIARRLSLEAFDCQDPYVERLLEGTAFLAARVEKKLDDGYGRFLEAMLNAASPSVLYPVPADAVLACTPQTAGVLPGGTAFDAAAQGSTTPCRFSTLDAVPLVPLRVVGAEYLTRDIASRGISAPGTESALCITLSPLAGDTEMLPDTLLFFAALNQGVVSALFRHLCEDVAGVWTRSMGGTFSRVEGAHFRLPVFTGAGLFGETFRGNVKGLQLLHQFLAHPAFFRFFTLDGAGGIPVPAAGLEIAVLFTRRDASLTGGITAGALKLNCAPALNVFARRSDRVPLTGGYEFHIVPDRAAPRDYEVFSVRSLEFFNERNESIFRASPFYDENFNTEGTTRAFFSAKRRRSLFENNANARSLYAGSEVFVSFSCEGDIANEAWQFAADLFCTNRDSALLVPPATRLSSASPLAGEAVFAAGPGRPASPLVEADTGDNYAALSYLAFNLSGNLWQEGDFPLKTLKSLIVNYAGRENNEARKMAEGIASVVSDIATFRFIKRGAVFFEQGWDVAITLDETAYTGSGWYLFGRMLRELLFSLAPLNTPLSITVLTRQSGEIAVWKALEE